ncbi:hypothetical protein ACQ5SI_26275 [Peribacillus frigoritolerans]|uniref:hypothetical protein n=1 Tax=Peribacillus frigoritolerans TaxID=450367 RepID=UPI003D324875
MEENSKKAITDFTKDASKYVSKLDDSFDEWISPYKDFTDTLGDIKTPLTPLLSVTSLAKRLKFKSFLKNFAAIVDEDCVTDAHIEKLERYLRREINLTYIAEIIDSSIESKSHKSSAIMGYYAGTILKELREIQYKDMIVLNALKLMNNKDLENFILLYEKFFNEVEMLRSLRVHDSRDKFENLGVPVFELENTIEKLKGVLILGYDVGGLNNVGNAWGTFKFNENSFYLYELITKSDVMKIVDIR